MLIAPIFKVDYLSKQTDSQNSKIKDVTSKRSDTSTSTYNIFKTAINRGTELIRSTFLSSSSKGTSLCSESSSAANKSASRTPTDSHYDDDSSSESSSSNASSPDSIQTELMFFKPIQREPRTSSLSTTKIIRLPSIRSTSSTSTIQTPCPSPFFIPISTQRQSAFTFVAAPLSDELKKKPKRSIKRKNSSSENLKSDGKSPKRKKDEKRKDIDIKDSRKTKSKTEKVIAPAAASRGIVTRKQSALPTIKSTKANSKAANEPIQGEYRRVTRSMKN